MAGRVELTCSTSTASVVDLPDPARPATSTSPLAGATSPRRREGRWSSSSDGMISPQWPQRRRDALEVREEVHAEAPIAGEPAKSAADASNEMSTLPVAASVSWRAGVSAPPKAA